MSGKGALEPCGARGGLGGLALWDDDTGGPNVDWPWWRLG